MGWQSFILPAAMIAATAMTGGAAAPAVAGAEAGAGSLAAGELAAQQAAAIAAEEAAATTAATAATDTALADSLAQAGGQAANMSSAAGNMSNASDQLSMQLAANKGAGAGAETVADGASAASKKDLFSEKNLKGLQMGLKMLEGQKGQGPTNSVTQTDGGGPTRGQMAAQSFSHAKPTSRGRQGLSYGVYGGGQA